MDCLVYVLAKDGTPLMPTKRGGKVRVLLNNNKARVVKTKPFTIQLLYETTKYTQDLTLGVDPGFKTIGLSVSSKEEEVYCAETEIRTDVKEKLSEKRNIGVVAGQGKSATENRALTIENQQRRKDGFPQQLSKRFKAI